MAHYYDDEPGFPWLGLLVVVGILAGAIYLIDKIGDEQHARCAAKCTPMHLHASQIRGQCICLTDDGQIRMPLQ